jgi:hypothetical protein
MVTASLVGLMEGEAKRAARLGGRAAGLSERQSCGRGDGGLASGSDGVDDLGGVDALEVGRGGSEVGVPELALDDDDCDAFARELDGVGLSRLLWRISSDPGAQRSTSSRAGRSAPALADRQPRGEAWQVAKRTPMTPRAS